MKTFRKPNKSPETLHGAQTFIKISGKKIIERIWRDYITMIQIPCC